MNLHILGLAHTQTSKEYLHCAYTMKVLRMCQMMKSLGHKVYHYGVEGSLAECDENVTVIPIDIFKEQTKNHNKSKQQFKIDNRVLLDTMAKNTPIELMKRINPKDFILVIWGNYHSGILEYFRGKNPVVEFGIGYEGIAADTYHVYESYAWQHFMLGMLQQLKIKVNNLYDTVIPNYFDPNEFSYKDKKQDYFLYLGRVIPVKGVQIAIQVTERLGKKLIIAGQNQDENGNVCYPGLEQHKHVEYVGSVGVEKRKELLANAKAMFVPTYYVEPFGGVCVESLFSGTPIITTDWGNFAEANLHGITGFRCRMFQEFMMAAENIDKINPKDCRDWAIKNYSMDHVKLMYQAYFEHIDNYWHGKAWYDSKISYEAFINRYGKVFPNNPRGHAEDPGIIGVKGTIGMPAISKERWNEVQIEEKAYWDNYAQYEPAKQKIYFKYLSFNFNDDFSNRSILDIGGGRLSVIDKLTTAKRRVIIDPLANQPDFTNVEVINKPFEEVDLKEKFTDILMYNVLEHVIDPAKIIENAINHLAPNGTIYIFDHVNFTQGGVYRNAHPHVISSDWLLETLKSFEGTLKKFEIVKEPREDLHGEWVAIEFTKTITDPIKSIANNLHTEEHYTELESGSKLAQLYVDDKVGTINLRAIWDRANKLFP